VKFVTIDIFEKEKRQLESSIV